MGKIREFMTRCYSGQQLELWVLLLSTSIYKSYNELSWCNYSGLMKKKDVAASSLLHCRCRKGNLYLLRMTIFLLHLNKEICQAI